MPKSLKDAIVQGLIDHHVALPEFTAEVVMPVIELWRYQNEARLLSEDTQLIDPDA